TKPINSDEVRARVRHQLERQTMLAELKSFNRELESKVRERTAELTIANRQLRQEINERRYMPDRLNYLATHDFVTRLHNRNALEAFVSEMLARIQVKKISASFLMIDIDRFRLINESCGCIAGDELLRQFADTISGLLSREDFFARLGGDRFAVVTYCDETDKGQSLARSILKHLEDFNFQWEDRQFKLAASIGTIPLTRTMVSYDQVMLAADEVIFVAKQETRGGVYSYEEAAKLSPILKENIHLASPWVDAIHNQAFRFYFQMIEYFPATRGEAPPKYRLEILMRLWDAEHQRMISPGEFIGPAERLHLIPELDKWI